MEASSRPMVQERRAKPQKDQVVNCPRCNSTNTKFCYYNNYSLSQPRYFCKTCRRYWTEGGSLRNVPVGGGSRKNKRPSTSPASSKNKLGTDLTPTAGPPLSANYSQNPKIHESAGQDLNLAYPVPSTEDFTTMELLKTAGMNSRGGLSSFMSMMPISDANNAVYASGFPMQDFKPTSSLNFSLDGFETTSTTAAYGNLQEVQESSGRGARLLFPMEELKHVPNPSTNNNELVEQNIIRGQGESTTGYWNGMLGGGHW